MFVRKKKIIWPVLIVLALSLGAIAFAAGREGRSLNKGEAQPDGQNVETAPDASWEGYVPRGALSPQLRLNLEALGERLKKPEKERMTLTGTLTYAGESQSLIAILEFPNRARMTMQRGLQTRVIVFDGKTAQGLGEPLNSYEEDLLETLVYDTAEHFFAEQVGGAATRFLGDHFRLDDGTESNYLGPFYDVYQTTEPSPFTVPARERTTLYYFDSNTLLLDHMSYQTERNGSALPVEVQIGNWQKVEGQQVSYRVVRLENNKPVLTLTINAASFGPKLQDGIFGMPATN